MSASNLAKIAGEIGHLAADLKKEIDRIVPTTPFLRAVFDDYQKIMAASTAGADLPDLFAQSVTFHLLDLSLRNTQDLAQQVQELTSGYFLDALVKELYQTHVLDRLLHYLEQTSLRDILKEPEHVLTHFYPTFISAYEQMRASDGSYFTPESVASFVVRSVDHLLRTNFDLADGLASIHKKTGKALVKLLDPAAGVGTYLLHAIHQIERTIKAQEKDWNAYVRDQLLPNICGFECYLPTYALARVSLTLKFLQSGYTFAGNEQMPIVLTDALAEPDSESATPPHTAFANEIAKANLVKRDKNIAVIVGTPPFAASTRRRPTYEVPKGILKSPLQDAYVQFLRLAHDYIQDASYGVIAVLTNNSYLSSPGFVRMREEWLKFFSSIYILNLQGNRRTGELSPSGEQDENIAGLQVGLTITLLVRERRPSESTLARIFYAERWGTSRTKQTYLLENDVSTVVWQELKPFEPSFFFNAISAPSHINLESNGLHSLQKGIDSYHNFQSAYDYWLLKECVMFLNHGIELLMKELLSRQSEYLIFEELSDAAAKQIKAAKEGKSVFDAESPPKTVTFDEAIRRVVAFINPPELNDELQRNLRTLNKLRNKIEHHEVRLDGQTVGQLIDAIRQPLHDLLASRGIDASFLMPRQ